jgi:glutaconate CoA-transferase subunit B
VFRTEHTRRSLVEKVDFVSAAAATPPDVIRLGHPTKLVTPKASFRFAQDEGVLKLDTIHSPWTLADIRENTGFDLGVPGSAPATKAPTAEELATLRGAVREKMLVASPAYAAWARATLVEPQSA